MTVMQFVLAELRYRNRERERIIFLVAVIFGIEHRDNKIFEEPITKIYSTACMKS